jgi:glycosyltransferase involved in cell wall biosynthesis
MVPKPRKRRPLVLHIASDYSDGLDVKAGIGPVHRRRRPTLAINHLVDGAEDFDHVVFSLRRMGLPLGLFLEDIGTPKRENVRVFAYGHFGLPLGLGLFHSFWLVARTVRRVLREQGLEPDAVHAHRLTFDGIGGWLLARALDIPLFISIRGEVEHKVLKFKPTYRPLMRRIVGRAAGIFYVSAWYAAELARYTGVDPARTHLLPNLIEEMPARAQPRHPPTAFVTVLNLDIWQKKGLGGLLPAFAQVLMHQALMHKALTQKAFERARALSLTIIGGGTEQSFADVRGLIARLGIGDRVRLAGALPNAAVRERMGEAVALVLPSHNETFGMVYLEALFAGVPILYSRGTGIDGFLDALDVGVAVDPDDIDAIACALTDLAGNNARYRANVAASADELSNRFGRRRVLARYAEVVTAFLPGEN